MSHRHVVVMLLVALLVSSGCADGDDPAPAVAGEGAGEDATVVDVVDGDTFDARLGDGADERVRLPQVDTPERDECGYSEASDALDELITGRSVRLVLTASGPRRDQHGRLLRAVVVGGDDVGAALVRSGVARWASHYAEEDLRLAETYERAEEAARGEGAGLWSRCGWL